jgi:hypothetical protein
MANSPISPRLMRWAFLIEESQSSRMRRASIKNDLPAGVSATPLRGKIRGRGEGAGRLPVYRSTICVHFTRMHGQIGSARSVPYLRP